MRDNMNSFMIGDIELGVGRFDYSVNDDTLSLEIFADEDIFDELCENDEFEFGWALDAPNIYFYDIPFNGKEISINEEVLEQCDVALYMMEHNDFMGKITILDNLICVDGEVDLMGEIKSVSIKLNI